MPIYPRYSYFPRWQSDPGWLAPLVQVFRAAQRGIDTTSTANKSDEVLRILRPGLVSINFEVEAGKAVIEKLYRPVFFGENGRPAHQYQIDAYNPTERVALEIEAVRAVLGNAIYRDIIQMSLLVDVDYAVVAVPVAYRHTSAGRAIMSQPYRDCVAILDTVYGGRRLELPFRGFLLIGY